MGAVRRSAAEASGSFCSKMVSPAVAAALCSRTTENLAKGHDSVLDGVRFISAALPNLHDVRM